jgi:hypothetical protein
VIYMMVELENYRAESEDMKENIEELRASL